MYTLSLESPAINNITTLLFNVLLETQGIRLDRNFCQLSPSSLRLSSRPLSLHRYDILLLPRSSPQPEKGTKLANLFPFRSTRAVTRERISRERRRRFQWTPFPPREYGHVEREKRKSPRGTARSTPQEYRVAAHVRTSLLGCRAGPVERISAVSRRALFNLHFICFRSGSPLFWHAHMRTEGGVPHGSPTRNAAGFLRNRITQACPARSALLTSLSDKVIRENCAPLLVATHTMWRASSFGRFVGRDRMADRGRIFFSSGEKEWILNLIIVGPLESRTERKL